MFYSMILRGLVPSSMALFVAMTAAAVPAAANIDCANVALNQGVRDALRVSDDRAHRGAWPAASQIASIDMRDLETLPEIAELRALKDQRQKWRLGLLLADRATLTVDASRRVEMMTEARSIALDLAAIGMKDWLLAEIVARQLAIDDFGGARDNTDLIEHPGWKADALILIARAGRTQTAGQAGGEAQRLSDWHAALCAALAIPDDEWRADALAELK